jgi:hypothetical protein
MAGKILRNLNKSNVWELAAFSQRWLLSARVVLFSQTD